MRNALQKRKSEEVCLTEIGKMLLPALGTLVVNEVVCSQSTFVGVNDIETDAELEVALTENEGTTLEEP